MLFLLGISLLGTVGSKFVPANSVHNISIETTNDRVEWKENGNTVLLLSYDSNTDGCGAHPQNPNFNGYCINKGQTYVLEILNTSNHDKSVFTGNQEICTIDYSASIPEMNFSSKVLEEVKPIHIEMIVLLTKPKPSLKLIFTAKDLTGNITEKEIESCGNTLTNYSISYDLYISNVRVVFQRDDISEFSLIACPYYGDLEDEYFGPASTPTIIKTADSPSPSSTSTPTQSSLPPNTSSTASSLTTASPTTASLTTSSLTTSSLTTSSLATQSVCDNIDCDGDLLVIIIVMACLGTLIVVVVVWVCCCCPFCLCYKCCKKKRDEDIEGREKSCQCCFCPFCVCYKRKKKNDKKSNPPVTKTTTRSSQYEMNTSNSQNYRNTLPPRATQPLHSYQDPSGYQFPRVYQTPRVYKTPRDYHNPRAHESYYGHGYNNAAFNYDENGGRNMARKMRKPQRPYTNNY